MVELDVHHESNECNTVTAAAAVAADDLSNRIIDITLSTNQNDSNDFKADHVILDTSALIRSSIDEISKFAHNLYMVEEVLSEIKDKKTRAKFAFLPSNVTMREPSDESYESVKEFSKKAGVFQALSIPDLKALALTYHLHVEHCGKAGLNSSPLSKIVVGKEEEEPKTPVDEDGEESEVKKPEPELPGFYTPEKTAEDDEDEKDVFDEMDDEGWITSSNLKEAQKHVDSTVEEESSVRVACVTMDYAMQQVLAQMGLNVLTSEGMRISKIRHYVLRCNACMKICVDLSKIFCPECGNKNLKKLTYTVEDDGTMKYHFSKHFKINKRGLKYDIPKPQGGKHGQNPWVAEDQRFPLNQASKRSGVKNAPLDDDFMAQSGTPFVRRDVLSRHFNIGMGPNIWNRRNPNENRPPTGNRKRNNKA